MSKGLMNLPLDGLEVEVEYEYVPETIESMAGPGTDEEIEILSVNVLIAGGKYQTELKDYIENLVWDVLNEEDRERGMEKAESFLGSER